MRLLPKSIHRCRRYPTKFNSGRDIPSKWEKIFKDPMTTAAAIDRLVHHSIILELNVASYRLEQSKKNKARAAKTAENREKE